MAAITVSNKDGVASDGIVKRYFGTSTANQADTLTSTAVPERGTHRLLMVTCTYSAAPTQAGVTVELDSGAGSGYDATFSTGAADAQETVYIPDTEIDLVPGDAIRVSAPAGGGGITAAIAIYVKQMRAIT